MKGRGHGDGREWTRRIVAHPRRVSARNGQSCSYHHGVPPEPRTLKRPSPANPRTASQQQDQRAELWSLQRRIPRELQLFGACAPQGQAQPRHAPTAGDARQALPAVAGGPRCSKRQGNLLGPLQTTGRPRPAVGSTCPGLGRKFLQVVGAAVGYAVGLDAGGIVRGLFAIG